MLKILIIASIVLFAFVIWLILYKKTQKEKTKDSNRFLREAEYNLEEVSNSIYIEQDIQKAIPSLIEALGEKRSTFLTKLKAEIQTHISKKNTVDVLTLITSNPKNYYRTIWKVNKDGLDYFNKLVIFITWEEKKYKQNGTEYTVDSVLTDEVLDIVKKQISLFYQENNELISGYFMAIISQNNKISKALLDYIVAKYISYTNKKVKKHLINQVTDILLANLMQQSDHILSNLHHNMSIFITKITSTSIGSVIAPQVLTAAGQAAASTTAKIMSKALMLNIKHYVATKLGIVLVKLMAIPIIKTAIKKLVVAAIIVAFYKFVAVQLGIHAGAILSVAIIAVAGWLLNHEWKNLPKKLGESIAESITKDLDRDFRKINQEILSGMFKDIFNHLVKDIAKQMTDDKEIKATIGEIFKVIK